MQIVIAITTEKGLIACSANGEATNGATDEPTATVWFNGEDVEHIRKPYPQVRQEALAQRGQANPAEIPAELKSLYKFWSGLLVRHFNANVYDEFRSLSLDDASHNRYGLQCLLNFYKTLFDDNTEKPWLQARSAPEIFQLHYQQACNLDQQPGLVLEPKTI